MTITYLDQVKSRADRHGSTLLQLRAETNLPWANYYRYLSGKKSIGERNAKRLDAAINSLLLGGQI